MWAFLFCLLVNAIAQQCPNGQYSRWMNQLRQKVHNASSWGNFSNATAFNHQQLNALLFGGSHDAGLYRIYDTNLLGKVVPSGFFLTQRDDLFAQACNGARFFDLRFAWYKDSEWRIFHGDIATAYGPDFSTVVASLKKFLDDRKSEVLFLRLKLSGGNPIAFAKLITTELGSYAVKLVSGKKLGQMTLQEIWKQNNKTGQVVLMAYEWLQPVDSDIIWDYTTNLFGRYANSDTMTDMVADCETGQQVRLTEFKASNPGLNRPLFGVWWTFTGGDIESNSGYRADKYPNGLNDFFARNGAEVGNFLIFDYFGYFWNPMKIIYDYNLKKYATFPAVHPRNSYQVMNNPELPSCKKD